MIFRRCLLLLLVFGVLSLAAGRVAVGLEMGRTDVSPSCVHEMTYEPFAGLILVKVTVGESQPLTFIVDTGASQSAINDPFLANALGLESRDVGLARGMGSGATRVHIAEDTCIRSDGVEILRGQLVIHDIGQRLAEFAGREIDGFLGAELFERYVVEIDPVGYRLLLHNPETFDYRGNGFQIPLVVEDRRPLIRSRVIIKEGGREVPVRLVVDTGAGRWLTLITKSRRHLKPPADQSVGGSIDVVGDSTVVLATTSRLLVGPIIVRKVETAWTQSFNVPAVRNIEDLNGILGNNFLSRFRTIFDYHRGRLILEAVDRAQP